MSKQNKKLQAEITNSFKQMEEVSIDSKTFSWREGKAGTGKTSAESECKGSVD